MTTSEMFQELLDNLSIKNSETISNRYGQITSCLNNKFRDTESKTANSLQVGSYGRWSGIKGISDLDMLYIMPSGKKDTYKDNQSKLLTDTKDAIKKRYPTTTVKVDRLIVQVNYEKFTVEVQPVFENDDGSFEYPDTYNGGCWKTTKPREEIEAMKEFVDQKNKNLRKLCKMARAWKNKHGVGMGGLLIDTMAYKFLKNNKEYDDKSYASYDSMCRDFFEYLSNEPDQEYYLALGSNQQVKVKKKFQKKAKKAYNLATKAIQSGTSNSANQTWKKIFGRPFPKVAVAIEEVKKSAYTFKDTEQFIEDSELYSIDIRAWLKLECSVSQDGFRDNFLTRMLLSKMPLSPAKSMNFFIDNHSIKGEFTVLWKVLNRGPESERRDCIRGQLVPDNGHKNKSEKTRFKGEHVVECYAIQNNVVIAKDRIRVPIQ